ncbi:hypothetical protein ACWGCW_02895 [Streptomyces sp. NPDC054933]
MEQLGRLRTGGRDAVLTPRRFPYAERLAAELVVARRRAGSSCRQGGEQRLFAAVTAPVAPR